MYSDPLCAPWLTVEGGFFIWAAAPVLQRALIPRVPSSLMLAPLHFMPGPWGARTLLPSHSGHLAKQGCISMPTESE